MSYTDYISNPKSDKWGTFPYIFEAVYRWKHRESGETDTRTIRTKSGQYAMDLIDYWNDQQDSWEYSLVSVTKLI